MSKVVDWSELGNADRELVERAQEACAQAYAPYSLFAVGAAARSKSGPIYTGANFENASSGLTICAEAAALTAAGSAGDLALETIAVVGLSFAIPQAPLGSSRRADRAVSSSPRQPN